MTNTLLNKQNKTKRKHPSFKVPPKLFQWNNKVHAALFFYYEQDSPKVDWILQWKSSFCMYAYDTCIYIHTYIERWEKYYTCVWVFTCMHVWGECVRAWVYVCYRLDPTPIPLIPCLWLFARIQSKHCCSIYPLCTADTATSTKRIFCKDSFPTKNNRQSIWKDLTTLLRLPKLRLDKCYLKLNDSKLKCIKSPPMQEMHININT